MSAQDPWQSLLQEQVRTQVGMLLALFVVSAKSFWWIWSIATRMEGFSAEDTMQKHWGPDVQHVMRCAYMNFQKIWQLIIKHPVSDHKKCHVEVVAYKKWLLKRGSKYSDLIGRPSVFWKTGHWGEVVAARGSTVSRYFCSCQSQVSLLNNCCRT